MLVGNFKYKGGGELHLVIMDGILTLRIDFDGGENIGAGRVVVLAKSENPSAILYSAARVFTEG